VVIPGFRNSQQAPLPLKIKGYLNAFEKKAELTALTIDIWSDLHKELKDNIYYLLSERGWEMLPISTDRTKLPGFLTIWPKNEDFSTIKKAYQEKFPLDQSSEDNISLMAVWLSTRLPYQQDESAENMDDK
jgi:hypothetical protein